jgi:hypothetical protein
MASRIRCITQSTSRSRKASSFPSDSKSMCGTRKSPKTFGYEPGLSLSSRFGGGFFDRVYGSPIISTPNNRHLFLVLSNRCNRCADARNNHAQKQLSGISGEYYPASSAYLRNNLCTRGYGFPVIHGRFLRCEEIFAATLRVAQSDLKCPVFLGRCPFFPGRCPFFPGRRFFLRCPFPFPRPFLPLPPVFTACFLTDRRFGLPSLFSVIVSSCGFISIVC